MQRPIEPGRGLGEGLVNLDPADATRPKAHLMDDVTDVWPAQRRGANSPLSGGIVARYACICKIEQP
jgi:hypothetical protein